MALGDIIRRIALAVAVCAGVWAGALPAQASTEIPGREAPEFRAALALWLADDEENAFPALAALAEGGNLAAQILLGVIDRSPALQGPWLAHLPRAERIALLRRPGGMSGQSWLHAAQDHPLAAAWLARLGTDAGPEVVETFATLGEPRAAREAFAALLAREHPAMMTLDPAGVEPELLFLLWARLGPDARPALAALIPEGHPQRRLMGEGIDSAAHLDWLRTNPAAAPLAALCAQTCAAAEQDACLLAAHGAMPSHLALLTLGSPVEGLIAQADFVASARGQASTLRRILLGVEARGRRSLIQRLRGESECLGERLTLEQRRYMKTTPVVTE